MEQVKKNILSRDQIFTEAKMNDLWKSEKYREKFNNQQKANEVEFQKSQHIKVIKKNSKSIKKLEKIESNMVGKLQNTIDLEKMVESSLESRKHREKEILNTCDLNSLKLLREASKNDIEEAKDWYKPLTATGSTLKQIKEFPERKLKFKDPKLRKQTQTMYSNT